MSSHDTDVAGAIEDVVGGFASALGHRGSMAVDIGLSLDPATRMVSVSSPNSGAADIAVPFATLARDARTRTGQAGTVAIAGSDQRLVMSSASLQQFVTRGLAATQQQRSDRSL